MGHDSTTKPTTDKEPNKIAVIGERFACRHYQRKCQFVSPCCNRIYRCRFCHDEAENHVLDRFAVREVVCSNCDLRQELQRSCQGCGIAFGAYSCLKCKLFDDDLNRHQYHCEGCGICRVGKASNYFHCDKCDMCLPIHMSGGKHNCIESVSRKDCPVCLEDIHTSREPSQIPPCHHLIHRSCFNQLRAKGYYRCPVCLKSMFNMPWDDWDLMLANNPMPARFVGVLANIKCFDCDTNGETEFHFVSLKCRSCGSHNTARGTGPLFKMVDGQAVEFDIQAATEINTTSRSAVTPDVTSAGELYNEQSSESSDEVGQESDDSWVDLECDGCEFGCDNLDGEDDSESGGEPNSEEDHSTDGSSYFLPSATEKED